MDNSIQSALRFHFGDLQVRINDISVLLRLNKLTKTASDPDNKP